MKINEYLNFKGDSDEAFYTKYSDKEDEHGFDEGSQYLGEWSRETNKPHGRGFDICSNFDIRMGYFNNGFDALGKYIVIYRDSRFRVGECYQKDDVLWIKGTEYKPDGTNSVYDVAW